MKISDLSKEPQVVLEQAATLLVEEFDEPRSWPTLPGAREEVAAVLRDGFARAMLEGQTLLA